MSTREDADRGPITYSAAMANYARQEKKAREARGEIPTLHSRNTNRGCDNRRGNSHGSRGDTRSHSRRPPHDSDRDHKRGGHDQIRGRNQDRGRDHNRGRDQGRGRDRDRDRGRQRNAHTMNEDSDKSRSRSRDRDDRSRRDLTRTPTAPESSAGVQTPTPLTTAMTAVVKLPASGTCSV